jgi:hypothetical protein
MYNSDYFPPVYQWNSPYSAVAASFSVTRL